MTAGNAHTEALFQGVIDGDRASLARAVTLVESTRPNDREQAAALTERALGRIRTLPSSFRIAVTGPPGVGKSTFINAFGMALIEAGHRVAVLAVDPSSERTGGSILGDKTRMPDLSSADQAFVRPSPSQGTLGGTAPRTREAILLCEAAGYDRILIETVGIGQSETTVRRLSDHVLLLTMSGIGDSLQGIKRGILEIVDTIAVNKTDGELVDASKRFAGELRQAMHVLRSDASIPVMNVSSLEGTGIADLLRQVQSSIDEAEATGSLTRTRAEQQIAWLTDLIHDAVAHAIDNDSDLTRLKDAVSSGALSPHEAADEFVSRILAKKG